MSSYIVPIIIVVTLLYGAYKKINIYNAFVFGAKSSLQLVFETMPYIVAVFVMIEVFSASGLNNILSTILQYPLQLIGIPKELIGLVVIKPFSGSGSIAMLSNIFSQYGVDSYLGRCASAIVGSSEAIFYVVSVYFVKTKVKKFGLIIPIAIIANLVGASVACIVCKYI